MVQQVRPDFKADWTSVAFRPYLLNPELDGLAAVDKIQHLESKLGKPLEEMGSVTRLSSDGQEYGLRYRYEPGDMIGGSMDSHRILNYVATVEGTEAAVDFRTQLMKAFNEEGADLSDRAVLLRMVEEAGVDTVVAEGILDSLAYVMDVRWMDREAKKSGIDMVPLYRFYTPGGDIHSVTDFYNEWHFLNGIFLSFPDSFTEDVKEKCKMVVDAYDNLNSLRRQSRRDPAASAKGQIASAEAAVTKAIDSYTKTLESFSENV